MSLYNYPLLNLLISKTWSRKADLFRFFFKENFVKSDKIITISLIFVISEILNYFGNLPSFST